MFKVRVNCWFCNGNFRVSFGERNSWSCPQCQQYNGFTADGDYNRSDLVEQNGSAVRYNTSLSSTSTACTQLCEQCQHKQALLVRQLAEFESETGAEHGDAELRRYRRRLEQLYRLCAPCAARVRRVVDAQDRQLAPGVASWRLQQQRQNRTTGFITDIQAGVDSGRAAGHWKLWRHVLSTLLIVSLLTERECWAHSTWLLSGLHWCRATLATLVPHWLLALNWSWWPHWTISITHCLLAGCCVLTLAQIMAGGRRMARSTGSLLLLCVCSQTCVLQACSHYHLLARSTCVTAQLALVVVGVLVDVYGARSSSSPRRRITAGRRYQQRPESVNGSPVSCNMARISDDDGDSGRDRACSSKPTTDVLADECGSLISLSLGGGQASTSSSLANGTAGGVFSRRKFHAASSNGVTPQSGRWTSVTGTASPLLSPARFHYTSSVAGRESRVSPPPPHCSSWIAGDFWQRRGGAASAAQTAWPENGGHSRTNSSQSSGFVECARASSVATSPPPPAAHLADDCWSTVSDREATCRWSPSASICRRHSPSSQRWSPAGQSVTSACTLDARLGAAAADWRALLAALMLGFSLAFNVLIVVYLTVR